MITRGFKVNKKVDDEYKKKVNSYYLRFKSKIGYEKLLNSSVDEADILMDDFYNEMKAIEPNFTNDLYFEIEKKIDSYCSKYKAKGVKSYCFSVRCLEIVISGEYTSHNKQEYFFLEQELVQSNNEKHHLNDALKFLKCNRLVTFEHARYGWNRDRWFEKQRYVIKQPSTLKLLLPFLVSFYKQEKDVNFPMFFDRVDNLLKNFTQASQKHNPNADIEKKIFDAIKQEKNIFIKNPENLDEVIKVKPIRIEFDDGLKTAVFEEVSSGDELTIALDEIQQYWIDNPSKQTPSQNAIKTFTTSQDMYVSNAKYTNVVLMVNTILFEYFDNTQPLNNQELILNPIEIENELNSMDYSLRRLYTDYTDEIQSANVFILKATDEVSKAISVVQQNLQYIKVLEPSDIINEIIKNIQVFKLNDGIEKRNSPSTPTPHDTPSKTDETNKESSSNSKKPSLDDFDMPDINL